MTMTSHNNRSARCRSQLVLAAVACAAIAAPAARAQDARALPTDAEVQFFADKKLSFDSQETAATSTKALPERPRAVPAPASSAGAPLTAGQRASDVKVLSVRPINEQETGSMKSTLTCTDALTAEVVPTPALRALLANLFKMKAEQLPPSFSWVTGRTGSCYDRRNLDPAIARELTRVEDAIRLEAKKGGL